MIERFWYVRRRPFAGGIALDRVSSLAAALLVVGLVGVLVGSPRPGAQEQAVVPAFPGAEGHGADTPGGRGGQVIEVTNLDDSGPGSFREAVEAAGPRIVVFKVGGLINLQSPIRVTEPYLTIAGQTAPGGGICLRNATVSISTHDVVVRHLRFRPGDARIAGSPPDGRDGLSITDTTGEGVRDVIVDHSSISWGIDENLSVGWGQSVTDVTVQWSIVSEGLRKSLHSKGSHSMGMRIGGEAARRVSVHHNLFAHNEARNPQVRGNTEVEIVNNVVYNWVHTGTNLSGEQHPDITVRAEYIKANIIGNYYKKGNNTPKDRKGVSLSGRKIGKNVYLNGNVGPGRPRDAGGNWEIAQLQTGSVSDYKASSPMAPVSGITTQTFRDAYSGVLAGAGATLPARDLVDERVVRSVYYGNGRLVDSPSQVGGYPAYQNGPPPDDTDHDGMPDAWERQYGLNPNDPADGPEDLDGNGYTNVEEYLNGIAQ